MSETTDPQQALRDRIRHDFTNHAPRSDDVAATLDRLTELAIEVGDELIDLVPPGRELSMALTDLESLLRNAKAGVARHQPD